MKSFKEFLIEGLIKLPKKTTQEVFERVLANYLSYIKANADPIKQKKHLEVVNKLATYYGVKLSSFIKKNFVFSVKLDVSDLPASYKASHDLKDLIVVVDWEGKIGHFESEADAAWFEKQQILAFNPDRIIETLRPYTDPADIQFAVGKFKADLDHEMTHVVQDLVLSKHDKSQSDTNGYLDPDIDDKELRKRYYTSKIEFDPSIKSAMMEFHHDILLSKHFKDKAKLREAIDTFVGIKSPKGSSFFKTNELFKTLKKADHSKWKKAVKLLYLNLGIDVQGEI
jgi:hypothetical protein